MASAARRVTVGSHIRIEVHEEILRRAESLRISKTKYLSTIVDNWFDSGAHGIDDRDREYQEFLAWKAQNKPKKESINAYVCTEIVDAIRSRAKRMGLSPTRFTSLILEAWFEDGANLMYQTEGETESEVSA